MRMFEVFFLFIFSLTCLTTGKVIVSTPHGQLRGYTITSLRNVTFYAFQEIPYGKPPVGNLRFRDPVPADPWNGIRDATTGFKRCHQVHGDFVNGTYETEDCLYLNVYTPLYPNKNNNIPVMVWIYGGGFMNGVAILDSYGPHYLMEDEIIVVTINYRLGAFGFLATGDTVIPGNYGLKDQNLALKWVRDNIRNFGGDPDKVTIFGQSAGAASVTYHLMSPESKGLFRGAIAMSGSLLAPWAYQRDHKAIAYDLAHKINGSSVYSWTTTQLLAYLQSLPAKTISDATYSVHKLNTITDNDIYMQGCKFTPVIEPNRPGAFITENMYAAVEEGRMHRVPLLMGIVSEEMLAKGEVQADLVNYAKALDTDPSALVCHDMHLTTDAQKHAAGKAIQQIYGGTFQQALWRVVKFFSDTAFAKGIVQHAKLQSKFSDVYFYEFSYHGDLGRDQTYVAGAERVEHSEDMNYIWTWGNWSGLNTYSKEDILTSDRYRELLTNFAKYLNPTPGKGKFVDITWPKVTPDSFQYLSINSTVKVLKDYKKDVLDKWVEVYEKYAVKPYDTF